MMLMARMDRTRVGQVAHNREVMEVLVKSLLYHNQTVQVKVELRADAIPEAIAERTLKTIDSLERQRIKVVGRELPDVDPVAAARMTVAKADGKATGLNDGPLIDPDIGGSATRP